MPLELLASPLKSSRDLGSGDRSALVIGGQKIRTSGAVVFCKVVAVAEAQVKRDEQVRRRAVRCITRRWGRWEKAEPVIGGIAERAPLSARFVKEQREKLLARAFMIRVLVLMTLMPEARVQDVIAALARHLALVPWARRWSGVGAGLLGTGAMPSARSRWRNCGTWC